MLKRKEKEYNFYIADNGGKKVHKYTGYELFLKLKSMDEVSRSQLIKLINNNYGYEEVNFKLMCQKYKNEETYNQDEYNSIDAHVYSNDALAKDYAKAYMKMLSNF